MMRVAVFSKQFLSCFVAMGMLAVMVGMPLASAQAQSSRELSNRLQRLENEIETLNHAVYRGGGAGASLATPGKDTAALANAEIRIQQLESEIRDLRGQIEQQSHEIRKLNERMERLASDVTMRVDDLEKGVRRSNAAASQGSVNSNNRNTATSSASTQESSQASSKNFTYSSRAARAQSDGQSQVLGTIGTGSSEDEPQDSAAALYENAFSLLKAANYEAAGTEFQSFLNSYPDHVLSSNAKYWLGETYYVRGNFERSARIFAEGFQSFPNSSKAPDYLLKLGMSLANMGKTEDACTALSQLEKEDYKNAGPVLRRAEQERSRLSCP